MGQFWDSEWANALVICGKRFLPVHVARVEERTNHDTRQVDRLDEVWQQSPLQP